MRQSKRIMLTAARMPDLGTTALHYGDLRPAMGLGFLAAYAEQQGHEVAIRDNYCKPFDMHKEIEEFKPDIIGMYMHTPGYYAACDLIDEIKEATDAPLVVGGPHASLMPHNVPDKVDFIVTGEGEQILVDLAEGLRPQNKIIENAISGRIKNLDEYPFPDYKHFINMPYNWGFDMYGYEEKPIFSMHTSRSCPYRCTFCGVAAIWSRKWTCFSADRIVHEIDKYVREYGCKGIYFREDLFTTDLRRVERMCDLLLQKDYKIKWACEARADITSEPVLEKMAKSGCIGLYCGVESGSATGLIKKKKDLTLDTMRRFFALTKKVGINVYSTFCIGTPTETRDEIEQTFAFIDEVKPFVFDKFAYLALPRSEDYDYVAEHKIYYHKDSAGIMYTERFYELANEFFDPADQRLYFLNQQRKFLAENRGKMREEELASHRFPAMPQSRDVKSSTNNEFRLNV